MKFAIFAAALVLTPLASATEIKVAMSDDFQEKLEDDYGVREAEHLIDEIREDLERELDKAGVSPARIEVTLNDARPNRPTIGQLGDRPGLDPLRSISIGGADLSAIAYDADGNEIASLQYDWYENNIRDVLGSATWGDANRAFSRFARKFSKTLAKS